MTRRYMKTGFVAICGVLTVLLLPAVLAARSPDVIIFYADDMGIGDVGCYGCKDIQTPNIDALARDGVRFTNYYSAAPVCSPSRAALLTGRYPQRAGVPGNVSSQPGVPGMPTDEVTIAELAKTRGYATALIGKWHLGYSHDTQPNAQGFDYFFGHHAGCIDYYTHIFSWQKPDRHDLFRNREEIYEDGQYMTDLIAREAGKFIDEHRDKPFLMYVAFNAPHYPMQAPERLRAMYANLPKQRADYAPLVAGLDEAIGKIMDRLRQNKLDRDTLVFFASDNGASIEARAGGGGGNNGPYRGFKFSLFDGGIHMPGIVSWPAVLPKNETRGQLSIAMDIIPTIAEAIGAALPKDRTIDGKSWMPLLKDPKAAGHESLCWSSGKQDAVRYGSWKLVRNGREEATASQPDSSDKAADVVLSDLQADPGEKTNVALQHPDLVKKMIAMHDQWKASVSEGEKAIRKPKGRKNKSAQ